MIHNIYGYNTYRHNIIYNEFIHQMGQFSSNHVVPIQTDILLHISLFVLIIYPTVCSLQTFYLFICINAYQKMSAFYNPYISPYQTSQTFNFMKLNQQIHENQQRLNQMMDDLTQQTQNMFYQMPGMTNIPHQPYPSYQPNPTITHQPNPIIPNQPPTPRIGDQPSTPTVTTPILPEKEKNPIDTINKTIECFNKINDACEGCDACIQELGCLGDILCCLLCCK